MAWGSFYFFAESGEVVVLRSADASGVVHETRLWVVDDAGRAWLRTGNPDSAWLQRVRTNPQVEVVRNGEVQLNYAVVVTGPQARDRINQLVLEKYGGAERYLRLFMMDPAQAVPVRLDPS
jgi:hypothetical protein